MGSSHHKLFIFISAALSLAIIALAAQVVFLTMTVSDQKENMTRLAMSNTTVTNQSKYNTVQKNLVSLSREIETLKNASASLSADLLGVKHAVLEGNADHTFVKQDLAAYDERMSKIESDIKDNKKAIEELTKSLNALKAIHVQAQQ